MDYAPDATRGEGWPGVTDLAHRPSLLLLVDALNLIRRVYAAQPGEDGTERAESARTASLQSLERALRQSAPSHAVCVFDGEGQSWRHELFSAYKEGHAPMPEALAEALPGYREAFRATGVTSLDRPGLEADDVIATMACKAVRAGVAALVLSTDKIFLELLAHGVRVRDHFRGVELEATDVEKKFGVGPDRLADLLALAGDRGNGIRGVPGIGPKTAAELLSRFSTLEEVLRAAADIRGALGGRLREHAEEARLSRRLVGLRTDLELGINLSELRYLPSG